MGVETGALIHPRLESGGWSPGRTAGVRMGGTGAVADKQNKVPVGHSSAAVCQAVRSMGSE